EASNKEIGGFLENASNEELQAIHKREENIEDYQRKISREILNEIKMKYFEYTIIVLALSFNSL
ncbi:MAG: hypothetical protein HRT42_07685, partial [Campylobacteraceae bacterium]|nr:hypothetical protein [Campylobacteraceae bacterium]